MNDRGIGDNQPKAAEVVADRLRMDYGATEETTAAILETARQLPKSVEDDGTLELYAKVVREARDHCQRVESLRKVEKEPYFRSGQAVDAFFNTMAERLTKGMKVLNIRIDEYQQEKLERARQEREAAERKARQEAEKAAAAAREAERKADRAKTAAARAEAEKQRRELEFEAKQKAQAAMMAQIDSAASPAELTRQRLTEGGMVTMKTTFEVEVVDYEKLPLDVLRPYIRRDAIDKAVRAWANATEHKATLPGVSITREEGAAVL